MVGLASVQLKHSISCLPSLTQTSLCPRQSVHPRRSLAESLPSTGALEQPDIWQGWTQCAAVGRLGRTRQRCAPGSPSLGMKGAPRCHLPPAPLPGSSLQHWDLTVPASRWTFPQAPKPPCHEHALVMDGLSLPPRTPIRLGADPPATSLLEGCWSPGDGPHPWWGRRWHRPSFSLCQCCWQPPRSRCREGTHRGLALPGHCLSPRQTNGFGGFGQDCAELVPPAQTCHQRDPAAHPPFSGQDRAGTVPRLLGASPCPCSALWLWMPSSGRKVEAQVAPVAQQPADPHCSAPCTSRMPEPTQRSPAPAGRDPEPSWVRGAGEGSTAPQAGSRAGRLCRRHQKEGVYRLRGPLLGRSRRAPGRGHGERSHQPRPLRRGRDALLTSAAGTGGTEETQA